MPPNPPQAVSHYLLSILLVLMLLAWRASKMAPGRSRPRLLRHEWLWITPLLVLTLTVMDVAVQPPRGLDWLWLSAALGIGGALGWWRGKLVQITVHPDTRALIAQASPGAALLLVLLVAARYALRSLVLGEAQAWHLSMTLVTGMFLSLGLGVLTAQRLEMYLRAERLLAQTPPAEPIGAVAGPRGQSQAAASAELASFKLVLMAATVFLLVLLIGLAISR